MSEEKEYVFYNANDNQFVILNDWAVWYWGKESLERSYCFYIGEL